MYSQVTYRSLNLTLKINFFKKITAGKKIINL